MITKAKTVSVIIVSLSLIYVCYMLGMYSSDKDEIKRGGSEIVINDRRRLFESSTEAHDERIDNIQRISHQYNDDEENDDDDDELTRHTSTLNVKNPCDSKAILDSITEYKNGNRELLEQIMFATSSCSQVVYNRVPKCGSRTVLSTFKILAKKLKYKYVSLEKPGASLNYYTDDEKMQEFLQDFRQYERPFLLSQHIHFINFTQYDTPQPVYINVIRDPLQRLISHYYYKLYGSNNQPVSLSERKSTKLEKKTIDDCVESGKGTCYTINQVIPFFCGQTKSCRLRSRESLQQAKEVASKHFLVVGITEDLASFMEVLEFLMPRFFSNAAATFQGLSETSQNRTKTVKKPQVRDDTTALLKTHLKYEYEFYNFAKQRFYKLLTDIRNVKADAERSPFYKNKRDFYKWWKI